MLFSTVKEMGVVFDQQACCPERSSILALSKRNERLLNLHEWVSVKHILFKN